MARRIINLIMAAVMALSLLPLLAPAAQAASISNDTGDRDWEWPVLTRFALSSYFNQHRSFMLNGRLHEDTHYAIDIPAPRGTAVVASYAGRVVTAQTVDNGGWGKHVIIEHTYKGRTYRSIYGHMDTVSVRVNNTVSAGQTVGTVGSTGTSTGPHLHFELRTSSGARIDPFMNQFLAPVSGLRASTNFPNVQGYIDRVNRLYSTDGGSNTGGNRSGYYSPYTGSSNSIVDALRAVGADPSMANRSRIAAANAISPYSGTAQQNTRMLRLLRDGLLRIPDGAAQQPQTQPRGTYPPYQGSSNSIVDALRSLGIDSSYNHRSRIAAANAISSYTGSAQQNVRLLQLLRSGQLIRP